MPGKAAPAGNRANRDRSLVYRSLAHDFSLQYQAHYDVLTGLPNRFLCLDRLEQSIKAARRHGWRSALLFLDLDDFKKVNDALGHKVGDQVLVSAAARLREAVREEDTVGRLGGDEFVVLIGNIVEPADVRPVAEKIVQAFQEIFPVMGRHVMLTASLGIAVYPDDGENPAVLLRNADTAMYYAKTMGRDTYHFFTESMNQDVSRRLQLEEQLRFALERNELYLVYQPVVAVESGISECRTRSARDHEDRPDLDVIVNDEYGLVSQYFLAMRQIDRIEILEFSAVGTEIPVNMWPMGIIAPPTVIGRPKVESALFRFVQPEIHESGSVAAEPDHVSPW